ncbi:MAG: pilus assembly protein PilM [Deltaproteobacteria bacterium]|nr:pilus assembly protein PilM [Deltaproteobacteria bacterium]
MIPFVKIFLDQFGKKDLVGLDIGSCLSKVVKVKKEPSGKLVLEKVGIAPNPSNPSQVPSLRHFIEENSLKGLAVACNLSGEMPSKKIEVPVMPESDLQQAILWMMKDGVEGDIDLYSVRSLLLDELTIGDTQKQIRLVLAIKKEVVTSRVTLLRQLGLVPVSLEPDATALLAVFDANEEWEKGKKYVFVDLGTSKTLFLIFSDQKLLFYRTLPIILPHYEKSLECQNLFGQLAVEIQRAVDAFCILFHIDKVERIVLAGGGTLFPEIATYLSKNMGIETTIFDPFKKIQVPLGLEPALKDQRPLYAIATGLALTEMRRG